MLLSTYSSLCTIGVGGVELRHKSVEEFVHIACEVDVILLIDSLQLGVEAANGHVLEALALNLRPVVYLVRGDVLGITGDVVRSVGVSTLSTDDRHQFVVLVRDEELGSQLTDAVNLVVLLTTSLCVGQRAILLVESLDFVQVRLLGSGVGDTEATRSLEH